MILPARDARISELASEYTQADVADMAGCSLRAVEAALERVRDRHARQKRARAPLLVDLVRGYDSVTVEVGLNGGYIVTIGDVTGQEKGGLPAAIRSAWDALRSADDPNDKRTFVKTGGA